MPTKSQLKDWNYHITHHTFIHESIKKFLDGFHYDAHPMGMLISTIAALSTFYPDAKDIFNADSRRKQTYRLIGKMPTLAAFAYRHSLGMPFVYPDNELSYCGNFLNMLFRTTELQYRPNPTLERALDVLFILHADHEQNCSSTAMRGVGSSHVDPYSATAAATAALYGPLHGGANEAVLRMLVEIGAVKNVPAYVKSVKAGEKLLMGFGHRVYKNYDPRAKIVKRIAYEVFDVMGRNPLIDIALECERIALEDEYFVSRRLYPNVDFYTGLIYQSMGFPVTMFPVLFAIPRTSGWIAQWEEMLLDRRTEDCAAAPGLSGLRFAQLHSRGSPRLSAFAQSNFAEIRRTPRSADLAHFCRLYYAARKGLHNHPISGKTLVRHRVPQRMNISTRQVENASIVDVTGDITLYNSPEVRKILLDLAEGKARQARDRESAEREIHR